MKVLILWGRRPSVYELFYKNHPEILMGPWKDLAPKLLDEFVSWPVSLCEHMREQGIDAKLLLVNDMRGQTKWAQERGLDLNDPSEWKREIALAQVREYRPDVLWLGSLFELYGDFVREAKSYCRKVIAWVGSPFIDAADVDGISVLLTENPKTLKDVQQRFDKVIVTKPGFPRQALSRVGTVEKDYPVTFVGGLSRSHSRRVATLSHLLQSGIDLRIFGYIATDRKKLLKDSLRYGIGELLLQGSAWRFRQNANEWFRDRSYRRDLGRIERSHEGFVIGTDMLRTLARSLITLNIHIDCASGNAGNMRMFEATGMGTCLLTEHSENIVDLFEPGREVVTYRSRDELVDSIHQLLSRPELAEEVARAGQRKTLEYHTIERMFGDIRPALDI